ncbi:adenylate/guanylate cyclase domain-containing protein [Microlunatus antarcticus]|uniref:Class 3 adenylate cyclase/type II secretory pathway pseudopilin PulG n=1 Tax=Microlunatus antarcticus TaxID=53388 RepID=A0A7W5P674_9ACTN|nr:class 3 adenylate cyclase/type II secretory pathway pseudopilin PulG [Microlunatus antarcticus]
MSLENAPTPALSARPRRRRRTYLWGRLGIRSKLLAMLLVVSILSILAASFFAYRSSSRALTAQATEQLTSIRDARTRQIQQTFTSLGRSAVLNSANATATEAMSAFSRDYAELQGRAATSGEQSALNGYYEDVFLPELRKNTDGDVTAQSFEPTGNAARYLQSRYTVPSKGDFDAAIKVDDAGDGSAWSADHAKYHPYFRQVVESYGYDDALLVDPDGNVVYTAYKGVDLGTNLLTGPYKDSGLEDAFRAVLRSNTVNDVSVVDFEPYAPSYDVPIGFALSPIGVDGKLTGVLVVQLPTTAINDVMTSNGQWAQTGLGESGESYLVGPDGTLRSTSRLLEEDPEAYRAAVVAQGTPPQVADRIVADKNPILRQDVETPAVEEALRGQTGTSVETDYLGRRVLTAYAPVAINGVNWAVISQIDEDEALRPVSDLLRTLGLTTLGIVLVITLASLLLARVFTRPVDRLVSGVRQVAGGDLDARVDVRGQDEFADLATAFNDMGSSLSTKQELLDAEMAENDRLLGTLMPAAVAERYRTGETNIAEEHTDVSVLYATIDNLDALGQGEDVSEGVSLLNELVASFDRAAERTGVEKVRVLRSGYIASCGLVVPRVDHALRSVDFATEMWQAVQLFSAQHGVQLGLRVGIDSGKVTSGLVGGAAIYDLWGDSVNLAFRTQAANREPGIYLTEAVHQRVRDAHTFSPAGEITTKTGEEPVWRLEVDARV